MTVDKTFPMDGKKIMEDMDDKFKPLILSFMKAILGLIIMLFKLMRKLYQCRL